ncbi:helix-turn-helix transcriptional regulator [uncultured Arthrobacter sp.]|uniref:ArsR/SmtB family transcription factor n=1 Tax=uncultured Arthrobacter sp. TaxID=114050 RepID=UPI0026195205|nr:metalloregulator ArsR/SmtB family transcription factor [uncultured Arthrobacter sp.]
MGFDDVFAVIAERTRRQILENLQDGDKAVGELVVDLQVSQPTVSKHLKVLREAGLVTMRAQGQKRYYSLERAPLGRVGSWLSSLGASGAGEGTPAEPVVGAASLSDAGSPPDPVSVPVGGIPSEGTAAERALSGAVLAVPDERHLPEVGRPQPGWTVGRAAGRAADLLAHLRRRRDTSA